MVSAAALALLVPLVSLLGYSYSSACAASDTESSVEIVVVEIVVVLAAIVVDFAALGTIVVVHIEN